ncbi:MAG: HDOD domain-containing protein [Archangium sp.]|nr:HDOD domain-containing protein [Archangium sp.]
MIGTSLLNYRIVRQLGAGGLGVVYEGEHPLIGRKAALKVLNPQVAGDEQMVARFLAEARAVNAIRHPNIVDVTDYGQANGHFVIVMELLEGETVAQRLESRPQLEEKAVIAILSQTASAVGAAHEHGIVHRDLKPENLFLTCYPDYPDFVKVLDFGIAKLLGSQPGQRTSPGLIIGTPAYMSPEQCLGEETLDHRSDVYSLGVVAWRLLAGRLPFEGNAMQMMHGHLAGTAPSLRDFATVSDALDHVIKRCLARKPEERFPSMKELRLALFALGGRAPIAFSADEASPLKAAPPPAAQTRPFAVDSKTAPLPPPAPAPLSRSEEEHDRLQAIALASKLKDIISKRLQSDTLRLPSLPEVAMKAIELCSNPDVRFAAIAAHLEKDPFISSRLLRVANSPVFGGMVRATTMESAVARLGIKQLLGLLQELAAEQVFSSKDATIRNAFRGIWEHCLGVAHLARDLATELKTLDPNTAYLAGLFHDIGKPVVAALLLEVERGASSQSFVSGGVWQRAIEECHRDVGSIIAFRWFLPREVAAAVASLESYDYRRGRASCVNVVRVANALCQREGLDVRAVDPAIVARVIVQGRQLLRLTDEQLEHAVSGIASRVQALTQANQNGEASTRVFNRTAS